MIVSLALSHPVQAKSLSVIIRFHQSSQIRHLPFSFQLIRALTHGVQRTNTHSPVSPYLQPV